MIRAFPYLQTIYQHLFDWVVHQMNSFVDTEDSEVNSIVIRVLDIYGFELPIPDQQVG